MSAVAGSAAATLRLQRRFDADIERVFTAWTDPLLLARWFGPPGFSVLDCEADLRVGGRYSIVISDGTGARITHFGEYVDIDPPRRVVFTWVLQNQACGGSVDQHADTLVTV